ncbi:nuclear pore complex protein DDB_G0274915-like isoform X2 [Uranotaenia lowii]|uniref:nuclear pore complex protein DDB_G0274915-like isoform X2 n=1 Tax=Uranotaenia lowii TaxID=190385 RepID=UPI00247A9734|nr:nuclear pore complex protein DDB_G0274915-like isoform X2 [Uranotaenia lowii]
MRKLWILVASALLAFANFVKSQETARNLYSSRYDNLDIDTILGSTRLVNNYVDCLLSRKPCPPEGKDLKRILPEALRTKCGRCSTTQKENALKIISTLYLNYPDQYQSLRERWDPTGEYNRRFEEYLRELQFNQIGSNGNGDRPVRNDFDRDQSQILLQTLILSSTSPATLLAPNNNVSPTPNTIPSGRPDQQQRPQELASSSAQLTLPVAPVTLTSTTTTSRTNTSSTTSSTTTTTTSTTTSIAPPTTSTTILTTSTTTTAQGSSSSSTVPSSTTVSEIGGSGSGGPPSDNNPGSRSPGGESQQTEANFNPIAAAGSEPNVPNNTSPPPATNPTSTSLSVAIDSVSTESTINLGNRFGFDNEDGGVPMAIAPGASGQRPGTTTSTARPTTTAAAVTARMTTTTTTTRRPAPAMTRPPQTTSSRQTTTTAPRTTTTRFGVGPIGGGNGNRSPIVGLFNQLGNKLATTADVIAGMFRKTVDVIVTSHLQAHQRAMRSFN